MVYIARCGLCLGLYAAGQGIVTIAVETDGSGAACRACAFCLYLAGRSRGGGTYAILRTDSAFDLSRLGLILAVTDGTCVVESISYAGAVLPVVGEGPVSENPDAVPGPPLRSVLLSSVWPSFRRSAAAIFSLFGLPLFLLALISLVKLLDLADVVVLSERMQSVTGIQSEIIARVFRWAELAGLDFGKWIPVWLVDVAMVWASVGATAMRAERAGLLAVRLTFQEMLASAWEGIRRFRIDLLFLALPGLIRRGAVQWAWPFVFLYRLSQPYDVEGPGPDGEVIVTTVARSGLREFVTQVSQAIGWKEQTLVDQRQVMMWHGLLSVGSACFLNWTLSLI